MKVMMCPHRHSYLVRLTTNLQALEIEVIGIERFSISTGLANFIKFCRHAKDADIIHFHWIPFNWYWMQPIMLKLCKFFKLRIVWTVHNVEPHITRYTIEKDVSSYKKMIQCSNGLIFHSKRSQDEFHKTYGACDSIETIIPHGNFNDFAPKELLEYPKEFKQKSRKTLQLPDDKIVLLLFPPNRWTKGIKQFVDIVITLDNTYIGILAGRCKDPKIKTYLAKIKERYPSKFIIHPDYVSKQEMDTYFAAADIFLMPYTKITTSGSILTAMAYQLPIITTDLGNLDMLVKNRVNGYLCKTREDIIEKIKGIDKELSANMGKISFEIAKTFDWKEIAEKTIDVYKSAIENETK